MTDGGLDRKDDFHFDKPDEELVKLEADLKKMCKLEDCHSAYLNLVIFGEELECGPEWCATRRGKEPCCKPDVIVCLECLREEEEKITVLEYGFANSFCDPATGDTSFPVPGDTGLYTVTETAWKEYKEDPKPPGMGSLDPPYTTVGGTPPASPEPDDPGTVVVPAAAQDQDTSGSEGDGQGDESLEPEYVEEQGLGGELDEASSVDGSQGPNGANTVAGQEREDDYD